MADYVSLVDVFELIDPDDVLGDEGDEIYALIFRGPMHDAVLDAMEEEGIDVDPDDLDELEEASAGVILVSKNGRAMRAKFFTDEDDLDNEWDSLVSEAEDEEDEDEEWS